VQDGAAVPILGSSSATCSLTATPGGRCRLTCPGSASRC